MALKRPQKVVLDTSALIATLYTGHPQNAWATAQRQTAEGLAMSAHSLAETYKVLTVHPQIRLSPDAANDLLDSIRQRIELVPLTADDYAAALARCAAHNLPGSVVFDALIAQAALKAGAGALVTLNPRDFRRLGDDVEALLVSP